MKTRQRKIAHRTIRKDSQAALVSVLFPDDDFAVAAYKEGNPPAIVVTRNHFGMGTGSGQPMDFETIEFAEFPGYKVWCCESVDQELRVCLTRDEGPNNGA